MSVFNKSIRTMAMTAGLLALMSPPLVATASADEPMAISLGLASGSIPSSIPRLANELGLFEKHGLSVEFTQMQSASTVATALLSGSVDFMTTSTPEPVVANARGQKVRAVAALYKGFAGSLTLATDVVEKSGVKPDAPVEERLKALDGLTIASVSATSNFTIAINCAAAKVGAQVNLTYLDQPTMVAALNRGAIQGFVASAPYYAVSEVAGDSVQWLNGPKGEFPEGCSTGYALGLWTMEDYAEENPEVITRIRAVFEDFSEIATKDPSEVKAALKKLYPDINDELIDVIYETESFGFAGADLNADGMQKEIEFIKLGETQIPGLESVDPAELILK